MFGIMKLNPSANDCQDKQVRLHYCGTCKSIGRLHNSRSRLLVNYDTSFLGEVLSGLTSTDLEKTITPFNCTSLPKQEEIPLYLEYAAHVSILLGQMKIEDNIFDSKNSFSLWRFAKSLMSKSFDKATRRLMELEFPIDKIWDAFKIQIDREQIESPNSSNIQRLTYYSEQTSIMTGLVFKHGARILDNNELEEKMYELGFAFGKLVYILDAYEDFASDLKSGKFNAIKESYQIVKIEDSIKEELKEILNNQRIEFNRSLASLPISMEEKSFLQERLEENLNARIISNYLSKSNSCNTIEEKMNLREKWNYAKTTSMNFINRNRPAASSLSYIRRVDYAIKFAVLTLVIWLAPLQASAQASNNDDNNCGSIIGCIVGIAIIGWAYESCCTKPVYKKKAQVDMYKKDGTTCCCN